MKFYKTILLSCIISFSTSCKKDKDESTGISFEDFINQVFSPEQAQKVKTITQYDEDAKVDSVETFTYDSSGRVATEDHSTMSSATNKLVLSYRYEYTRNANGDVTVQTDYDLDDDDQEYVSRVETTTYSGRVATEVETIQYKKDGTKKSTQTQVNDAVGRTLTDTTKEGDVETIETCEYSSNQLLTDYTCTIEIDGTVTETEIFNAAKRNNVTKSYVNKKKGEETLNITFMASNPLVMETYTSIDDGNTTEKTCTLSGDQYTCSESEKDSDDVVLNETDTIATLKTYHISTGGFDIRNYPWDFDTKKTVITYDGSSKTTKVTTTEYNANMLPTGETVDNSKANTVDVTTTTYDRGGARPTLEEVERTKGSGTPYITKTEYEY